MFTNAPVPPHNGDKAIRNLVKIRCHFTPACLRLAQRDFQHAVRSQFRQQKCIGRGRQCASRQGLSVTASVLLPDSWQGALRDEADQFAAVQLHSVAGGMPTNGIDRRLRGCGAIVNKIHADLGLTIDKEAQGPDRGQTAVALAYLAGYRSGDGNLGGAQENVEGNENRPGPNHNRARRARPGRTKVWQAPRKVDFPDQGLIFTAPDVGQIAALSSRGRFAVEVDGHIQLITDASTQSPGKESAVREESAADRDERNHIGRAQSGMDAPMPPKVNAGDSHFDRMEQPLQNLFRRACDRENGAVVVRIAGAME